MLDTLARKSLWEVGLNYMHKTGHGVGAYLTVHEGIIYLCSLLIFASCRKRNSNF